MEKLASDRTDRLFETDGRLLLPVGALVAPELDFDAGGVRAGFQFVGEPLNGAFGNPVQWSPRTKLSQAVEQIEPGAEAATRTLPRLVPIPEPQQFPERPRVRHRQVKPADYRLVVTNLAVPAPPGVAYGEVRVRFELRLFVTEVFEPGNALRGSLKVGDRACDLQHDRALGRDAGGIITQGHRIVIPVKYVPKTLKDRLEPLALARSRRQAQVACAAWSGRTLIRNRGGDR